MRKKTQFIKFIQYSGTAFLVVLGLWIIFLNLFAVYSDLQFRSEGIRTEYIKRQERNIKQEVLRVAHMIRFKKSQADELTRKEIKERVYQAYAIAEHLYEQYHGIREETEIQRMVIEALRPVRFADNTGYYFATQCDGVEVLFADRPEIEGTNLLNFQDEDGRYVVKDMIDIISNHGEGFYEYSWTKPGRDKNKYKKISFVKHFGPWNWLIGCGLYVDDAVDRIATDLLADISQIRFGSEGYIFVNRLNGDALVSNGKVFPGTKKLWEVFDDQPEMMKEIFAKEYQAASQSEGGYIKYTHFKLSDQQKMSEKSSYIMGLPELDWLIGAGVYLDDIENDIKLLQGNLRKKSKENIAYSILVVLVVVVFFFLLLRGFNKKLQGDMDTFSTFLQKAAHSDVEIDRSTVKFVEFDTMAGYANKMVEDRKEGTRSLMESEARMLAIISSNANPIIVYDNVGAPQYMNPAFTEVFGWSCEQLQGDGIPFIPENQQELTSKNISQLLEIGEPVRFVTQRQTKEGKILDVIVGAALIESQVARSWGIVVNLIDISEQKKLESQLRQAQKMDSVGRLAGGVAHDFNNMLGVIIGNTEIAMEIVSREDPAYKKLQEVLNAALRSADVTRQLLAFARKQTIEPRILDLNATLEGMLKMIRRLIGENIELLWKPGGGVWRVHIDPGQLDQILANLCVNARDAIADVGKVTIETGTVIFDQRYCDDHPGFRPGEFSRLSVSDNGQGMDSDTKQNLFEPFFTTKNLGKGTGLGLATVYGIVKQNDGFINVYSEPDLGTCFKIYLPACREVPSAEVSVSDITLPREEDLYSGQETLLLVEDEPAILTMAETMLEGLGYTVLACAVPDDAIKITGEYQGQIDLLITDVVMPGMNGRELANRLGRLHPGIKCLFMSGYTANVIAHHGVLDEGVHFLQKPFSRQNLAKKVRQALELQE